MASTTNFRAVGRCQVSHGRTGPNQPHTHEQAGHRKASLECNAPENQEASSTCVSHMQLVLNRSGELGALSTLSQQIPAHRQEPEPAGPSGCGIRLGVHLWRGWPTSWAQMLHVGTRSMGLGCMSPFRTLWNSRALAPQAT